MIPQLQRDAPVSAPETVPQWSLAKKFGFRFAFSYFLLYMCPRAIGSLGGGMSNSTVLDDVWHAIVPWVGQHLLGLSGDFKEVATGSGDELYHYVLWFCITVMATVGAVVWSWLDRKRPNYQVLYQWLRIVVRVSVAIALMAYGCNKIFRTQFLEPSLVRLVEPYGRTSPMDLLWTFMGYSRMYSFFGGLGEMLGAFLLLIPQLTALGCLVSVAVMTNVLVLNLAYDVPRKIYCVHLILMSLFLLLPDMRRLFDFFVLNRPAQLTKPVFVFKDKFLNWGMAILVLAVGLGTLIVHGKWSHDSAAKAEIRVPSTLRGAWTVDELVVDGVVQPPMITDSQRWRRFILDSAEWSSIQFMDDHNRRFMSTVNANNKTIALWQPKHEDRKDTLTYELTQPDRMVLQGVLEGHQVTAKLTRIPPSDPINFELTNRGFHWVNSFMDWRAE